ncbi:MAG: ABC transporter permease [Spirochaetales bacterium]|nr:ABC transporter permease [Spirochaetales bacterium]
MKSFLLQVGQFWLHMIKNRAVFVLLLLLPVLVFPVALVLFHSSSGTQAVVGVSAAANDDTVAFLVSALQAGDKYDIHRYNEEEGRKKASSGKLLALIVLPENAKALFLSRSEKSVRLVSAFPVELLETLDKDINRYIEVFREMSALALNADSPVSVYLDQYLHSIYTVDQKEIRTHASYYQAVIQGTGLLLLLLLIQLFFTCSLLFPGSELVSGYVTGLSSANFALPVLAAFAAATFFACFQVLFAILPAVFVFRLPFEISWLVYGLFILVFSGFGFTLAISIFSFLKQKLRFYEILFLFVLPGAILSGSLVPLSGLPASIRLSAPLFPQYWVMDAVRRIQNGSPGNQLLMHAAILLAFSGLSLFTALLSSRHRIEI